MEAESSDPAPPKPQAVLVKVVGDWMTFINGINSALSAPANASVRGDVVALQTCSADDHSKLLEYISLKGFEFSAPPPKSVRPRKVVLKGLPPTTSPDDIKSELAARGFVVSNIVSMLHRISRAPLGLFLLDVVPSDNFVSIYDISLLLHLKVKLSAFKPGRRAAQCHTCQRFGHHSFICNFSPRCVKCGGSHASSKCDKPRTDPARCANCSGRHTANYLGCPRNPLNLLSSKSAPSTGGRRPRDARPPSKSSAPSTGGRRPRDARPPMESSLSGPDDRSSLDARPSAVSDPPASGQSTSGSGPARKRRRRRPRAQKKNLAAQAPSNSEAPPSPPTVSSDVPAQGASGDSSDLLGVIGEIRTLCSVFAISDILLLFRTLNAAMQKASSPEEKLTALVTASFTFFSAKSGGAGAGSL